MKPKHKKKGWREAYNSKEKRWIKGIANRLPRMEGTGKTHKKGREEGKSLGKRGT